jgi:hypothetical protein
VAEQVPEGIESLLAGLPLMAPLSEAERRLVAACFELVAFEYGETIVAELAALRAAGRLSPPLDELAASYVHIWLNRLCRSQNTFQEYVTYALLARVLAARAARERARR